MRTMGYMPTEMELIELSQNINMNRGFCRTLTNISSCVRTDAISFFVSLLQLVAELTLRIL